MSNKMPGFTRVKLLATLLMLELLAACTFSTEGNRMSTPEGLEFSVTNNYSNPEMVVLTGYEQEVDLPFGGIFLIHKDQEGATSTTACESLNAESPYVLEATTATGRAYSYSLYRPENSLILTSKATGVGVMEFTCKKDEEGWRVEGKRLN